jgi:peptidyl-prolyl cis-trans isomerase SurA
MSEKVAADSNRFELSQLPNPTKLTLKPGTITAPLVNTADNTASFAYVVKQYTTPEQRSFADAKGMVINDYQSELEKQWIAELKKKYPVQVNEKAFTDITNKK